MAVIVKSAEPGVIIAVKQVGTDDNVQVGDPGVLDGWRQVPGIVIQEDGIVQAAFYPLGKKIPADFSENGIGVFFKIQDIRGIIKDVPVKELQVQVNI